MVGFPERVLKAWRPGDLDGFLALALDNLINILLILGLCRTVLGYPDSLLFGVILPATGISLLVGNLAYANQAMQLARREQRTDCTALPYGINTISLFAYIFLVMLPVKLAALGGGLSEAEAITRSWQAGVMGGQSGRGVSESKGCGWCFPRDRKGARDVPHGATLQRHTCRAAHAQGGVVWGAGGRKARRSGRGRGEGAAAA